MAKNIVVEDEFENEDEVTSTDVAENEEPKKKENFFKKQLREHPTRTGIVLGALLPVGIIVGGCIAVSKIRKNSDEGEFDDAIDVDYSEILSSDSSEQ